MGVGRVVGKVWKDGDWWISEIPALDITTQGHDFLDSVTMAKDTIESLIGVKGFKAFFFIKKNNEFEIESNNKQLLMKLMEERKNTR